MATTLGSRVCRRAFTVCRRARLGSMALAATLAVVACQPSPPPGPGAGAQPTSAPATSPPSTNAPAAAAPATSAPAAPAAAAPPTAAPAAAPPATTAPAAPKPSDEKFVYVYGLNPKGGWLLETDDAHTLASIGVSEMLTKIDFEGNLKPSLATEWTQTSPTTWEFTLRDGVKFQDGSPVDAAAAANSLTRLLQAPVPSRFFNPKTVSAVEAVGAKVKITTTAPTPILPLIVASPPTAIMSGAAYKGSSINPLGTGTGPFIMTSDNLPQSVTLKANPDYWGGKVMLNNVEVRFVSDVNTRASLARSGEAHLVSPVAIASVPTLKADPNLKIVQASVPRTTTLYINNAKPPLNDVRVRQAIQSAIDVKSLTNDALEGTVIPAIGPFAPSEPFAPPGAQPAPYDLAKAQSLLAEAGIDPKTVTLGLWTYPGRPDLPTIAVAIQAMLKKLGLTIEVRLADYNSLEPDALAGNFDMFIGSRGHLADVNDPLAFMLADYGCKGAYQMSHYCDAGVDEQLAKAGTLSDTTQRYAIYREIAAKMQAEAVDVYLYHETEINVQSTRVQGFKIHPLHNYVLTPELTLQPK